MTKRGTRSPLTEVEQDLLARVRAGEGDAFQTLVRPHVTAMLALGRRLAGDAGRAEELVQETLVRAFSALGGFRGEASLKTWLFRIEVRLAADPHRWRSHSRATPLRARDVPDGLSQGPLDATLHRELRHRLDEAMERLPARQRTALHLRAVEGLDYASIAGALECSAGAARMLVLEARRRVAERMGRYLEP